MSSYAKLDILEATREWFRRALAPAHKKPASASGHELLTAPVVREKESSCAADASGERAAAMRNLIAAAKLNGLTPEQCLRHVLECVADHPVNPIGEVMPWKVAGGVRGEGALALNEVLEMKCGDVLANALKQAQKS